MTDDSDEDLQEFVPDASTVTPKLAASPAKAAKQQQKVTQKPDKLRKAKIKSTEIPPEDEISEDEFDDDSSLLSTSNLLPPQMPSLDPSREQSDDGMCDRGITYTRMSPFQEIKKTFVYHWYNVRPTLKTVGRRCTNGIQMFCVCWVMNDGLLLGYNLSR